MQKVEKTLQDRNGNVVGAAVLTITDYPGGATSTAYATDAVGTNVNPITLDSNGQCTFYIVPGAYTYTYVKSGITTKVETNVIEGSASQSFLQSGTGAVSRTVSSKLGDIKAKADFGTLAQAIAAASAGFVLEQDTGQIWLLGGVTPTFDEASNVVARCLGFDTGATLTIPTGKQFDAMAWGDTGTDQIFSVAATGIGAMLRFNMTSAATSIAGSNLYGVIGALTNLGPGNTKALYGRAIAGTGCTGVVTGAVIGAQSIAGATAYGMQMTFDTDTSGKITAGIWQTSNTVTTAKLDYGILLDDVAIQAGGAGFQLRAKSTGDFIRLNSSDGLSTLFSVDSTGAFAQDIIRGTAANGVKITTSGIVRTAVGGNLTIDAGSGASLYLGVNGAYALQLTATNTIVGNGFQQTISTQTYSASITPVASNGNIFVITATNNTAFTINTLTSPATGQKVVFTIRNTSGGALGVATWNAVFKMVAWTQPANGFSRSIQFHYDGTNWIEEFRGAADVPN